MRTSALAHLAPAAAPRARYELRTETRGQERSVPYTDRAAAVSMAFRVAEDIRLGRTPVLWVALDDLHEPEGSRRIFFAEKKVGQ